MEHAFHFFFQLLMGFMSSNVIQMWMSARRKRLVSAEIASAKIPGVALTAAAKASAFTCVKSIRVYVRLETCLLASWVLSLSVPCLMNLEVYTNTGVGTETKSNWTLISMLLLGLGVAGLIGYAVYKYRFRVSFMNMSCIYQLTRSNASNLC